MADKTKEKETSKSSISSDPLVLGSSFCALLLAPTLTYFSVGLGPALVVLASEVTALLLFRLIFKIFLSCFKSASNSEHEHELKPGHQTAADNKDYLYDTSAEKSSAEEGEILSGSSDEKVEYRISTSEALPSESLFSDDAEEDLKENPNVELEEKFAEEPDSDVEFN